MQEITLSVPHAILFLNDPAHGRVLVPEYLPGQVTSANPSCVSINTRADVDGDVTVRLDRVAPKCGQSECNLVVEHLIETPSHKIGVFTSENNMILVTDVADDSVRLCIGVDDPESPRLVCIRIQ